MADQPSPGESAWRGRDADGGLSRRALLRSAAVLGGAATGAVGTGVAGVGTATEAAQGGAGASVARRQQADATDATWPMFQGGPRNTGHAPGLRGIRRDVTVDWEFQPPELDEVQQPILADGTLVVKANFNPDDEGSYCRLYGLDPATGEVRWQVEADYSDPSPPAYGDGLVACRLGTVLHVVDVSTGEVVWEKGSEASMGDGASLYPTIVDGRLFLAGGFRLRAFDLADGTEAWSVRLSSVATPAAVAGGRIYVRGVGQRPRDDTYTPMLHVLDADSGEHVHRRELGREEGPAPVLTDNALYLADDAVVYRLPRAGGEPVWSVPLRERTRATPAVADGRLFVLTGSRLLALGTERGRQQWRTTVENLIRAPPVLAGGTLYVVGGETITALDAATGAQWWTAEVPVPETAIPGDGRLFFGKRYADDGYVAALSGTPVATPFPTRTPTSSPTRTATPGPTTATPGTVGPTDSAPSTPTVDGSGRNALGGEDRSLTGLARGAVVGGLLGGVCVGLYRRIEDRGGD